ncbi:diguanylate cyclase/phosphodiesterase [Sphingomonas gellani]|uniref:Diguanylate cyclase/phosphodiesterase n=1 Tax=Sphingomonas gellani TaxID=1166340 RepID=A0A1H7YEU4_9SPHN|nr:EAL domain-containing protein [Sphingomonas gellani]SEM44640.1 diguanylate cyclase/phosphodiesterase [Sphingomonas gellani]
MTLASGAERQAKRPHGEYLTGPVTGAAILLFIGTGSMVLGSVLSNMLGRESTIDQTLLVAMLLNIAIIMLGWSRYRAMTGEVRNLTAASERAEHMAAHDPLTGFLNRRSAADEGAALFALAARRGKALAMLMLDLDRFKTVNDLHGHAVGDALLRHVATEIAGQMPQTAMMARLGGDEFACAFLFDPAHPDTVERAAEGLLARLSRPITLDGIHLHISASIGLNRSDIDCSSVEAMMRSADIAMYAAKTAGRNRFAWFDRSMEHALQARNEVESGLRDAIPQQQIVPYFEQQVDLATGQLSGFEVLARWEHPLRGLIGPEAFIPVAEETGMIADLSLSIIRQAFLAARDWHPSLTLSVNISPWQLKDAWLAQKIIKVLTETGFPASRLEVEITESSLFDNLALAQSIVGSLKNQGIRLALDDFGTGYSSLAHLRALPFDRIKIDKSFVTSICENPESAAIVTAIAKLGDSLNLPTTAEGIEDADTEERLRGIGCAKGQGYLYGRPMSAAKVRQLLAERGLLIASGPTDARSVIVPLPTARRAIG